MAERRRERDEADEIAERIWNRALEVLSFGEPSVGDDFIAAQSARIRALADDTVERISAQVGVALGIATKTGGMREDLSEAEFDEIVAPLTAVVRSLETERDEARAKCARLLEEVERWKEIQQEEVNTNLRIAERIGILARIKAGQNYEDAEVAIVDELRAQLREAREECQKDALVLRQMARDPSMVEDAENRAHDLDAWLASTSKGEAPHRRAATVATARLAATATVGATRSRRRRERGATVTDEIVVTDEDRECGIAIGSHKMGRG